MDYKRWNGYAPANLEVTERVMKPEGKARISRNGWSHQIGAHNCQIPPTRCSISPEPVWTPNHWRSERLNVGR